MQLWKWLNSTALMAPEGEGDGGGKGDDKLGGPPSGDKGTAANPIEYGFDDNAFDAGPTEFVIEDGPTDSEKVDDKATREADAAAAAAEDTTKGGDGDDSTKGGDGKDKPAKKPDDDDDAEDDSKLPKGVRRRIERAQRQTQRAEAEAEELRKQLKAKGATDDDPADLGVGKKGEPPNAADFDSYEDYLEAKALFDKGAKKPEPKKEEKKPDPKAEEGKDKTPAKPDPEVVEAISSIAEDIGKDHAELWAKVTADGNPLGLQITRDMLLAISDADEPATILQALADNPALSKEIAALSPAKQVRRIVKLDGAAPAKKGEEKKDTQGKPAPKLSQAPEPIPDPGSGKGKGEADPISDFTSFEQQRNAEESGQSKDFW